MNDFEDEALARLRAADPAQGAHPNLHRISERLRGRTPLGSQQPLGSPSLKDPAGQSLSQTSDTVVRVMDPHHRTGRGGLLVAASVAALAMAGGGYAVGASVAGGDDPRGTVAAQDEGQEDSSTAADSMDAAESGSAESYTASSDSGGDMGGGYLGPVIPVAGEGLSTERTTGAVYAPAGGAASGAVDQLRPYAEGLGIEGEVQDYGAGADLTDATDGRAVHLYVHGGQTSFDYTNPALDSWCQQAMDEAKDLGYSPFGAGGPQEIECATLGEPPSGDQAISAAQELLDQAGVDHTGYTFSVEEAFGWFDTGPAMGDAASSTAEPDSLTLEEDTTMLADEEMTAVSVVASDPDSPVGDYRTWHFSVTSAGVSSASVQLGELVELGDYEVISATEAVERANDVRFQQLGVYIPDLEYAESYGEEWQEPEPLPAVEPGGVIPFPLGEATITEADLHTGVLALWDGTEFLVPAWNLTDADGNSWQVLGLAEDALDFTP